MAKYLNSQNVLRMFFRADKGFFSVGLLLLMISCNHGSFVPVRQTMFLNGTWKFALDTAGKGIAEKWFATILPDSVKLPGTLDENKKGIVNTNTQLTKRLSREFIYSGMAWYQKEVNIPEDWKGKNISLIMERTKPTKVWIDTILTGSNNDILTAQVYDLSSKLLHGRHTITIMVNNGIGSIPLPVTWFHAWNEETQTNWNGITGNFCLEASNPVCIKGVQVYTNITGKNILVKVKINNPEDKLKKGEVILTAKAWNSKIKHNVSSESYQIRLNPGENSFDLTYKIGDKMQLWSEFNPALYKLSVLLKSRNQSDNLTVDFGIRKFSTVGTQFTINGIKTFLRGKHDACVFPLTGYPPMDVPGWQKVFRIAKSYNINFYRFHTWTPPEAAFKAADIEGIYLQPELTAGGYLYKGKNLDFNTYLLNQGEKILSNYGNHASFVMFALGNEIGGDQKVLNDFLNHFKSIDDRPLMAYGSNNSTDIRGHAEGEDYFSGKMLGPDTDSTYRTYIRASDAFKNNSGGYINGCYPSTSLNYEGAIANCSVPAIGFEVGQYQIYPNFDEIKKYTGVLKPWNFEVFRKRLEENYMSDQASDFLKASGALSVICYRAEIEMAMRTPGFGGFNLLDLQDYPGQGSALVGILDAFMDSKGLITPKEFSHFCNRVVPLFIMEKYCWKNNETFTGKIRVANYSERNLPGQSVKWNLKNTKGEIIADGKIIADIANGKLTDVMSLNIDLSKIVKAEKLTLSIELDGTPYENNYPLWIYPAGVDTSAPADILVSYKPDKKTFNELSAGRKVLLFPDHNAIKDLSVGGLFTPDFWNYAMFKRSSERSKKPVSPGTLGILTNPDLPLFIDFPTEFYTNWQWWPIVKKSRPFILDNTPKDYRPLVQVVDNVERNHKLGLIFEFSVGKGKLLICMSDLKAIQDKPEARQLYCSIIKYMMSDKFRPGQKLTTKELAVLFNTCVPV